MLNMLHIRSIPHKLLLSSVVILQSWRPVFLQFIDGNPTSNAKPGNVAVLEKYFTIKDKISNLYLSTEAVSRGTFNLNNTCIRDLIYVNEHLKDDWAQRMIEASSHPKIFLEKWNTQWAGDEDYCRAAIDDPNGLGFRSKYCVVEKTVTISAREKISMMASLCLPDTCDRNDIMNVPIVRKLIYPWMKLEQDDVRTNITNAGCPVTRTGWDSGQITMMCILVFFLLLSALGTSLTMKDWMDHSKRARYNSMSDDGIFQMEMQSPINEASMLLEKRKKNTVRNFLKCFCFITNSSKILSVKKSGDSEQLQCLHGIRFLSMTWIILIHAYTQVMDVYGILSTDELRKTMWIINDLAFQGVVQSAFAVDTFFLLSGTLVGYLLLQELSANHGKVSWLYFYVHRYWRLTPLLAIVQGFYITVVTRFLRKFVPNERRCKWWLSLLYVNNLVDETRVCMSWVWYLADDMQFYIVSPLFIYSLWRWPRFGLVLTVLVMVTSWIVSGVITWQNDFIPGYSLLTEVDDFIEYGTQTGEYFLGLYIKPYGRIGPYLIGILLAYLLHRQKNGKKNISRFLSYFGWCTATVVALVDVYGIHGTNPGKTAVCIYNAVSRSCFAGCVTWVIYACLNGCGGPVNWILSRDIFVPLSRLTYSAYLIHPILYLTYYDGMKTPLYMTHTFMVTLFFSCLLESYILSFFTSVLFESPFMAIEKAVLKKPS